jgi:hypothetical protein
VSAIRDIVAVPHWLLPSNWQPHIALLSPYKNTDLPRIFECLSHISNRFEGTVTGLYVDDQAPEESMPVRERIIPFTGNGA